MQAGRRREHHGRPRPGWRTIDAGHKGVGAFEAESDPARRARLHKDVQKVIYDAAPQGSATSTRTPRGRRARRRDADTEAVLPGRAYERSEPPFPSLCRVRLAAIRFLTRPRCSRDGDRPTEAGRWLHEDFCFTSAVDSGLHHTARLRQKGRAARRWSSLRSGATPSRRGCGLHRPSSGTAAAGRLG